MNTNNKYSEEEVEKWKVCYRAAGRAVLTDFQCNDRSVSDGDGIADDLTITTHLLEDVYEFVVMGEYVAKEHVRSGLAIRDQLEICLAGLIAEKFSPTYDASERQCEFGLLSDVELDQVVKIARQISDDPFSDCFSAGNWIWQMLDQPRIQTAIHDLAKFLFLSKDDTTAGEMIDDIITWGLLYGQWSERGRKTSIFDEPWERLHNLKERLGWEVVEKYWPDACAEFAVCYQKIDQLAAV